MMQKRSVFFMLFWLGIQGCGLSVHAQSAKTVTMPSRADPHAGVWVRVEPGLAHFRHHRLTPSYFHPVAFSLLPGQCKAVRLSAQQRRWHAPLRACYLHHFLYVDVLPQKKNLGAARFDPALRIHANALWQRGLYYQHLATQGPLRLEQAGVFVKKLVIKNR